MHVFIETPVGQEQVVGLLVQSLCLFANGKISILKLLPKGPSPLNEFLYMSRWQRTIATSYAFFHSEFSINVQAGF